MGIKDDYSREGHLTAVRAINNGMSPHLQEWTQAWSLSGPLIICNFCGGSQEIFMSGGEFSDHSATCSMIGKNNGTFPLATLSNILDAWRMELWDDEEEYI